MDRHTKKTGMGRRKSLILTTVYVLSCTDLDTRMAPTELRVPEAMIALDLWLPAVQEVAVNFFRRPNGKTCKSAI